jgi:hypothetical protein
MIRTIDFHFPKIRPLYLSQTHHQSLKSLQCHSYNANHITQIYLVSSNLKYFVSQKQYIYFCCEISTWVTWLGTFFYCTPKFTLKLHLHTTTKPFHTTYNLRRIWQLSRCCVISTWELCMKCFLLKRKSFWEIYNGFAIQSC